MILKGNGAFGVWIQIQLFVIPFFFCLATFYLVYKESSREVSCPLKETREKGFSDTFLWRRRGNFKKSIGRYVVYLTFG